MTIQSATGYTVKGIYPGIGKISRQNRAHFEWLFQFRRGAQILLARCDAAAPLTEELAIPDKLFVFIRIGYLKTQVIQIA